MVGDTGIEPVTPTVSRFSRPARSMGDCAGSPVSRRSTWLPIRSFRVVPGRRVAPALPRPRSAVRLGDRDFRPGSRRPLPARDHEAQDQRRRVGAMATKIDEGENRAVYKRPEWMTDDRVWAYVSAEMTERWLALLDAAGRATAAELEERARRRA